jgi:hypothetical protein
MARPAQHHRVPHPKERLREAAQTKEASQPWIVTWNDRLLDWLSENVLASIIMFDIALIVPLIVIPLDNSIKITLGVISSSWIHWWALPALQRAQLKADRKRDAKADADHEALTHIARKLDEVLAKLDSRPA